MRSVPFYITFLVLLFSSSFSFAQENNGQSYTISGYVKDDATGEFLIGTSVYIKENKKGTATNVYGFYSLTVPEGEYTLVISFLGYSEYTQVIKLDKDLRINVSLKESVKTMTEVEVTADAPNKNVKS